MHGGSTAFASFDIGRTRKSEGINGSLTPARRPQRAHPPSPVHKYTNDDLHRNCPPVPIGVTTITTPARAITNGVAVASLPSYPGGAWEGERSTLEGASLGLRRAAGGAGISLQETEARIDELERNEFDLKMRLFYTEERLEEAIGGTDSLQLHREIAHTKRVRDREKERKGEGWGWGKDDTRSENKGWFRLSRCFGVCMNSSYVTVWFEHQHVLL